MDIDHWTEKVAGWAGWQKSDLQARYATAKKRGDLVVTAMPIDWEMALERVLVRTSQTIDSCELS